MSEPAGRTREGEPLVAGWDTCTLRGVIALGRGEELLSETYFKTEKGHTGALLPLLDRAIKGVGAEPRDIDVVAVGAGQGNFTGLKVGVATAKAVALTLGVPVVGLGTLEVLAASAPPAEMVVALIDARRGQYFAAVYRGGVEPVIAPSCLEPGELVQRILAEGPATVSLVGAALPGAEEALEEAGIRIARAEDGFPLAGALLAASAARISDGGMADAFTLAPSYLRKAI